MENNLLTACFNRLRRGALSAITLIAIVSAQQLPVAPTQVLVVRPEGRNFKDAVRGMTDDLGSEVSIAEMVLDHHVGKDSLDRTLRQRRPAAIILMDNLAIRRYRECLSAQPDSTPASPTISIMGIMVGNAIAGLRNAEAISYEIPIVTSVVNLRAVTGLPIKKIGIVYREIMQPLVDQNQASCNREGITIISRRLSNKDLFMSLAVQKALIELFEKEKVDALWVPNDNMLLTPSLLAESWLPRVRKYRKPVIVGIEALAAPDLDFGTLAVLPDHVALGMQAASLILASKNNQWTVPQGNVEQPLSVYKILNLRQARKLSEIKNDNLKNIDKILE